MTAGAPEARSRAGQVGHLLLALDVVATAARAAGEADTSLPLPSSVATALALIEDDVAFPWTLTELSRLTYVGPTHLARSFARSLGMPPMHYLTQIRAERAAVMLTRTDDTVASIGAAVGWPDPRTSRAGSALSSGSARATFATASGLAASRPGVGRTALRGLARPAQDRPRTGQGRSSSADRPSPMLAARTRLNAFLAVCRLAAYAIRGGGASMRQLARTRLGVLTIVAALAMPPAAADSAVQPRRLQRRRRG